MRLRLLAALVVISAIAAAVAPIAGASRAGNAALTVAGASVTQDGQKIVFRLRLTKPFSTVALRRNRRSLCLLIAAAHGGITGQLCVIRPAPGARHPRLVYQHIDHGVSSRAHVVDATVRRAGPAGLIASFMPSVFGNSYRPFRWQVRNTLGYPACVPAGTRPDHRPTHPCESLYPSRSALARVHLPQVVGCVPSGPAYVTNGPSDKRVIALTFDDGPWYDTPQFLDVLEHYHVPATFFEIGDQIGTYGEGGAVERRMLADGDMIGDHTWSHPDVAAGGTFARDQIEQAAAAIRTATHGFTPCLFRAPYGDVSPALISEARSLGFTTIQWDIDPRDWSLPGTGAIVSNVLGNAHPGAIIIQHDGGGNRSETLAALPTEISTLKREGYTFVTVTQLLGQKLIYR